MLLLVEIAQGLMNYHLPVRPTYQHSVSGLEMRTVAALLEAVDDMGLTLTSLSQDKSHPPVPGL